MPKNYSTPEPPPLITDEPAIIDLVIEDVLAFGEPDYEVLIPHLRDRKAFGISKHGTPLQKSNGRDHRADGFQEMQDLLAYLRQGIERGDDEMRIFYYQSIVMATEFAKLVEGGKFDYSKPKKTARPRRNYDK
jgi:hypothetical protein